MPDRRKLIISLLVPLVVGSVSGIGADYSRTCSEMVMPYIALPASMFLVVWAVFYLLMGVSLYFVWEKRGDKTGVYFWFLLQLALNALWSTALFIYAQPLIAFIILVLLIISVIVNIKVFLSISRKAGLLLIPYLIWLIYLGIINYLLLRLSK